MLGHTYFARLAAQVAESYTSQRETHAIELTGKTRSEAEPRQGRAGGAASGAAQQKQSAGKRMKDLTGAYLDPAADEEEAKAAERDARLAQRVDALEFALRETRALVLGLGVNTAE